MGDEGSALEKSAADLTVMDVYDIAALVGQEFERLIDRFGCEALARLVPKVVRVLELLEAAVTRSTSGTGGFTEAEELRLELERLRLERTERLERDRKHKKELELVEDVWRGEAQDLLSQIALLQQENQSLLSNLSVKESPDAEEETQRQEGMMERERQVMKKLKEVVDKQRDEIRAKDRELTLRNEDVEALQQQQSRLMRINQELRQRLWVLEAQGRKLIQQKVELEAQDQERQQELQTLHRELQRLQGRNQNDHSRRPERGTEEEPESLRPPSPAQEALSEDAISTDQKDSNRPRFTLQELRDVLHERNELKAKVFMLQEELAYYRSEDQDEEAIQPLSEPSQNSRPSSRSGFQPESGIKRLFSFFSRDKSGGRRFAAAADGSNPWTQKNELYTEQAQEALQHM